MNVLFVCREKGDGKISPITQAQAKSLGGLVAVSIFSIKGKGWKAYLRGIFDLRKYLRSNHVDLIHAHYSYIGMIASLATKKQVVVSLMGSDIYDHRTGRYLIRFFDAFFWSAVIVKSDRLKKKIRLNNAFVIPNGVNLDTFKPIDFEIARNILGFAKNKKYILFLADTQRKEKNYILAKSACDIVKKDLNIELKTVFNASPEQIPIYLSAGDVLLLTSLFEGSPNVIKEAMACNCPIVASDVGDIKYLFGDTEGCYVTTFVPSDVAERIKKVILRDKRTYSRQRIIELKLDDHNIALRIVKMYKAILD